MLCTDKTHTITEGVVTLQSVTDLGGQESDLALQYAYVNASFQTGFSSPIDDAIRNHGRIDISAWKKLDEVPYDFVRKRLSVLAAGPEGTVMITKGALAQVLEACTTAVGGTRAPVPLASVRQQIDARFAQYSASGQRTLGLACKNLGGETRIGKDSESGMHFLGFILFSDPPKPGIEVTIGRLRQLGVSLKVITGDPPS